MNWWSELATIVQGFSAVIAVLVGGVWAIYTYRIRRQSETALDMLIEVQQCAYGSMVLISIAVKLTNRGQVRIDASRLRPAFEDDDETVHFPGHVRLRPITAEVDEPCALGWFDGTTSSSSDLEGDFLNSYVTDGSVLFWLEPGESHQLDSVFLLKPGLYMGMATFIGSGSNEFWRRTFLVDAQSTRPLHDGVHQAEAV